jgi:hypothetical protein
MSTPGSHTVDSSTHTLYPLYTHNLHGRSGACTHYGVSVLDNLLVDRIHCMLTRNTHVTDRRTLDSPSPYC